jgi:4-hydroxy-2-oxoheptanedioate aldolase
MFPATAIIDIFGQLGADFIYVDGEHGCFEWHDIETACITAERWGMTPIARVPDATAPTITRFLDRGVKGIIVPHVESVDDAKRIIDATYFMPQGNRTYGSSRPERGVGIPDKAAYFAACNEMVSLSIMIESRAGLDVAGDVAELDGVDYLSFGLFDLAQSLGRPGNPSHPDVVKATNDAGARVRKAGKPLREDFITFAWARDLLIAGAEKLLDLRAN